MRKNPSSEVGVSSLPKSSRGERSLDRPKRKPVVDFFRDTKISKYTNLIQTDLLEKKNYT